MLTNGTKKKSSCSAWKTQLQLDRGEPVHVGSHSMDFTGNIQWERTRWIAYHFVWLAEIREIFIWKSSCTPHILSLIVHALISHVRHLNSSIGPIIILPRQPYTVKTPCRKVKHNCRISHNPSLGPQICPQVEVNEWRLECKVTHPTARLSSDLPYYFEKFASVGGACKSWHPLNLDHRW